MNMMFIKDNILDLDAVFKEFAKNPALITPTGEMTFDDFKKNLLNTVNCLYELNAVPGSKLAFYEENHPLHMYLLVASWLMKYLYFPLDFKAPVKAFSSGIRPDIMVSSSIDEVHSLPDEEVNNETCHISTAMLNKKAITSREISLKHIEIKNDSTVVFTSGSTGSPKGVVLSIENLVYSAMGTIDFLAMEPSDRWLISLPLNHVGGIMIFMRTFLCGACAVLPKNLKQMESDIIEYSPTLLSLVPTQLMRLIKKPDIAAKLKNMKTIMLGGAPAPEWLIDKALNLGLPIMPTYGMTESCAQITGVKKGSPGEDYYTSGAVLPFRKLWVDEHGVVNIGGKTLFKHYIDEDGEKKAHSEYFRTSDMGCLNEKNNLVLQGRADEVFISGGENINPFEIETILTRVSHVFNAIVVPVPHHEYGDVPWAFIECDQVIDIASIKSFLRDRLPGYKIPKKIIVRKKQSSSASLSAEKINRRSITEIAGKMANDPKLIDKEVIDLEVID